MVDKVFQEEAKKLAETEHQLEAIATRYDGKATRLTAEILDYYCVDNEDRMRKRELIQERESAMKVADKFRSYQPSPYFGRLDLDEEDDYESSTYYIGKTGISDGAHVIVIDWRTPIGSCFYAFNQKEFSVNGSKYILALRRSLDIKDGTLVSYRTEYDGEVISLEGDVIDPFLLTVLKDKRRHNRLTDIIRTIQSNQNDIIRKPRVESFVVQGCAGSGKTMILLHRLSYLKFNNRNMSFNGVKIITPNKFFDAHINDLSNELGLTAIERFSVEEYYVSLIKRYSSKINADANVSSEKVLSVDLLSVVYSMQYLQDSIAHYHEYWEQVLSMIDEANLRELFSRFKIAYPNTTIHAADTASRLEQGVKQISGYITEFEKKKKTVLSRLSSNETDIAAVQAEYDAAWEKFEITKNQTISRISIEIDGILAEQTKYEESIVDYRNQRKIIQEEKRDIDAEIKEQLELVQQYSSSPNLYFDYDKFVLRSDTLSNLIRKEFAVLINSVIASVNAYEKTPVYNFGKRNNLRKKIAEDKETFTREVSRFVSNQVTQLRTKIDQLRAKADLLNGRISEINDAIREIEKERRPRDAYLSALRECAMWFQSSNDPNPKSSLHPTAYKECSSLLVYYEEQRNILNRVIRRLNSLKQTRQSNEEQLHELTKTSLSDEEIAILSGCAKTIQKLQFREVTRNVMLRDLLTEYRRYDQKYQKTNYRHKLYLKLLFASMYYPRFANPDNFLNIDEAQDISIAEYQLLRMVLGDRCVFNLYGDINQSVYSYKGVADWEEISDITSGNVYVLNENYRNTLQITEFCNEEFGAEVYPIGVSGDPVFEMNTTDAVNWILDIKRKNPEYRVAILHRHGLKAMQDELHSQLDGEDVSWYIVDEKKLSVLSVEMAKGLEFEAVVALVDQMTNNEKYIAYTRALDRLVVVRDLYSDELDIDDVIEGIDDEFESSDDTFTEISEEQKLAIQNLSFVLRLIHEQKNKEIVRLQLALSRKIGQINKVGKFYSWEIIDESTAVKTCDKTFFAHNESGVPKDVCWFFDSWSLKNGESRKINFIYNNKSYDGKILVEAAERSTTGHSRMRILWNTELGTLLNSYRDEDSIRAVFYKINEYTFGITMLSAHEEVPDKRRHDSISDDSKGIVTNQQDSPVKDIHSVKSEAVEAYSDEESAILLEFNSVLEEHFGDDTALSSVQRMILCQLYRGNKVAFNAPSGSLKTVMLYLLALKEHTTTGKQTILTAEAHLQENELVLAEKLGLKGGVVSDSMNAFLADFKKDKYDVIFVPYEFFEKAENTDEFREYFSGKIAYWGVNHPVAGKAVWSEMSACCEALGATMYLMAKEGFDGIDLTGFRFFEIVGNTSTNNIKKHTFIGSEERLKWLLANLDKLYGQGLIYCNDDATCKMLSKSLRKNKVMAEAYIDVFNPDKKERVNYLTNSFSSGGLPVLVTTHEVGKNLSNPRIRFVVHYDVPESDQLHMLHVSQIGQLADRPVVYDLIIM